MGNEAVISTGSVSTAYEARREFSHPDFVLHLLPFFVSKIAFLVFLITHSAV